MLEGKSSSKGAWSIDRIMVGDGTTSPGGVKALLGRFYGSAVSHGAQESFWEIDGSSVCLSTRGASEVRYSIKPVTQMARAKGVPRKELKIAIRKSDSRRQRQQALQRGVKEFCRKNPGFAVLLGGPGDRTGSRDILKHVTQNRGEVFMRAAEGECLTAALVNAVAVLEGPTVATDVKRQLCESSLQYRSLASCGRVLHTLCRKFDLRKVPKEYMQCFRADPFGWLGSLDWGVWIVRLVKPRVLDHCIVVDGARKLIFDSAEQYPLRLSAEVLRLCGGGEGDKLHVAEAREVHPEGARIESPGRDKLGE